MIAASPTIVSRAYGAVPRWATLLFVAVLARMVTFGNPIVHVDEDFYFTTATRWLEGALPYVDVWDRKPVGLFLIYLPAAALGVPLGIYAYQLMALASVVMTALLIARIADRAGWQSGATTGAALYILFLNFADGQGGQSPIFYNLLVIAAFALVLPRVEDRLDDPRRLARAAGAMLLFGLAMQVKYSAVFEGAFLGLWLLWREHRLGASPARIARIACPLVLIASVPTFAAWASFAAIGHGDDFIYANFGSILDRRSDLWYLLLLNFLKCALILAPLLWLARRTWKMPVGTVPAGAVRDLAFGWLAASLFGFLVFGSWFNHYTLPVMVPAAICASGFIGSDGLGRRLALPLLIGSLAVGQILIISSTLIRGTDRQIEAFAQAIGHGPGCLYLYSGNSALYTYTQRCAVTRWTFPSHLTRNREEGAVGVDQAQEIDRIFTKRPQFVVMRPPYPGERPEIRARALAHLKQDYRRRGEWPVGNLMVDLYEAKETAAR